MEKLDGFQLMKWIICLPNEVTSILSFFTVFGGISIENPPSPDVIVVHSFLLVPHDVTAIQAKIMQAKESKERMEKELKIVKN